MSWPYVQESGRIYWPDGRMGEVGYSGHGPGVNNPDFERLKGIGPIPCGWYSMQPPDTDPELGEYVIRLVPHAQNQMFSRSGFCWHGDELHHLGEQLASHGCIVHSRQMRQEGWESGDHIIHVIARPVPPVDIDGEISV